jgi:hypothetical protein
MNELTKKTMLKKDIIEELEKLGIEHDPTALKPELLALLDGATTKEDVVELKDAYVVCSNLKHDGEMFTKGDTFTCDDEEALKKLLEAGVIK